MTGNEFELLELERYGKRNRFKVGQFEPEIGDYLLTDKGELHKVEMSGSRNTLEGKKLYIETTLDPGLLVQVHQKMKFARLEL